MIELTGVRTGATSAVTDATCVRIATSCGETSGAVITVQRDANAAIFAVINETCVRTGVTCAPTAETYVMTAGIFSKHDTDRAEMEWLGGGRGIAARFIERGRYLSKDSAIQLRYSSLPASILRTTNSGT